MTDKQSHNPWKPEDEGDHYPVMKEWWTIETFFHTLEDKRKWNLISSFDYKMDDYSSFFQYILFDITAKKPVASSEICEDIDKISFRKNKLDVKFEDSYLKGNYPSYKIHIADKKKDFIADIDFKANSLPHWIAQDKTNGYLPIGLNNYKYGFLPNGIINGKLHFQGENLTLEGRGYLEHAWGNWSYQNPFNKIYNLKNTLSIYTKLGKWWLSQNRVHIPKTIEFSTDNNAFGYDWIWGVFDNDWSLFFGNSLFWINEGPSFGALYLTKDGVDYSEFGNVRFHYNKLIYIKDYDIYYPSGISIKAKLDDKEIDLKFWKTTDSYEYISPFKKSKFYKAWIICEMPGQMQGVYKDQNGKVNLKGDCKIIPLRIPSIFGHNTLKFDFLPSTKNLGINIDLNSHYFMKKINFTFKLAVKPKMRLNIKKLEEKNKNRDKK